MSNNAKYYVGENKIFVRKSFPDKIIFKNPIIFVHGAFGGAFIWNKFVDYFTNKGFVCYALSFRGHKLSKKISLKNVTLGDYVSDIRTLVNKFSLGKPILIGHSMGGVISLMYSAKYITKSVIALDSALISEFWGQEQKSVIKNIKPVVSVINIGLHMKPKKILNDIFRVNIRYLIWSIIKSGKESGVALHELVEKSNIDPEKIKNIPILIIGTNYDEDMFSNISSDKLKQMAIKYNADFINMESVTHMNIVSRTKHKQVAKKINNWIKEKCV